MADVNLLRSWTHPVYGIALPGTFNPPAASLLPQRMQSPLGMLPGAQLFAGLMPEQLFWIQHMMGQGVGQLAPAGAVNPSALMQMLAGPQGAIMPPEPEY